jgi:DmsE family decaheme c-type cytochrome
MAGRASAATKQTDSTTKATGATTTATGATTPAASGYAGQETCVLCHADEAKNFPNNPHSKLALMHSGQGVTCEGCHGPGQAHVDAGGDPTKIFSFTKATAKEASAKCESCHAAAHPNFERSAHAEAGVSCISCHRVHTGDANDSLLKAAQPQLCYQCHTEVKTAFAQPFHHKVDEGLMKCTDCHDPHGTFNEHQLQTTAAGNLVCTKCHTETAGPFVYEHPPVKTEGCTSCHSPHGSPNPRLLNVGNVNSLCLQCHTQSSLFSAAGPAGPSHNQAALYVACTSCHTQVHGSNTSSVFFR